MALVEQTRIPAEHSPLFVDGLRRHGSHPALISADATVTYEELADRVDDVAARLLAGGERRLVLVSAANTVDAVVAYLAALRADQPMLLAPASHPVATAALIDAYDPDVVLDGPTFDERRRTTDHALHPDLALLLSTSGSTGSPKLVRLSRRNLESNAGAIAEYLALTPDDRAITTLPLQYCYGLSVLNSHLHAGATVVLDDRSVTDPGFWQLCRDVGVTGFGGVPHTFDLLDRVGFDQLHLPTLRYVTQAGGRMDPAKVRRFAELGERRGWDLFVMYGQTEATARIAYLPPALAASHPHTIGIAIPGGALTIEAADRDGVGELVYRGPNVMLGYADSPADLALGATIDELRTGDLARRTEDGLFEVVGRRSRFVKPFGIRVDLDRTEALLARHGITACCAGDDTGIVIAVTDGGDPADAAELVCDVLGLPRSKVVAFDTPAVPLLPNGKPDHRAVVDLGGPRGEVTSAAGGDPVGAVYASVLAVEPGPDDTFVSLGGDSLSYVEASVQMEEVLGTLPRDWHTTPIRRLTPTRRTKPRLAATDTTVVLRAVGIVLIVGTHARLWQVPGGAHVLLAVAGFNFGRFLLRGSDRVAAIVRLAVPCVAWIGAVAAISDKYGWPNALLVHGIVERPGDKWGYWFVEALVQTLVVVSVVLAVPAVRRLERSRPFEVALAAVAIGLVFRFDVVAGPATFTTSRPHEVFWLFALGWAASQAQGRRQRIVVTALAVASVPGFFANSDREVLVLAGVAAVVWLPTVPLPRLVQRAVMPIAGASLCIYLTHYQVFPAVAERHGGAAAVLASVAVGVVASAVASWVVRSWRQPPGLRRSVAVAASVPAQ